MTIKFEPSDKAKKIFDRGRKAIEAARNSAKFDQEEWRIDEVNLIFGYAEPGYGSGEDSVVALGNWNDITGINKKRFITQHHTISSLPSRLGNVLEKIGIELEWSDEWTTCSDCGRAVRTQADSYGWQQSFVDMDGEAICHNCLDPYEFLESIEGRDDTANTISNIKPTSFDYVKVEDNYQNGWYPGQTDDPKKIAAALRARGIERFIFNIESVGQFDVHFGVYVHESEADLLKDNDSDEENDDAS